MASSLICQINVTENTPISDVEALHEMERIDKEQQALTGIESPDMGPTDSFQKYLHKIMIYAQYMDEGTLDNLNTVISTLINKGGLTRKQAVQFVNLCPPDADDARRLILFEPVDPMTTSIQNTCMNEEASKLHVLVDPSFASTK